MITQKQNFAILIAAIFLLFKLVSCTNKANNSTRETEFYLDSVRYEFGFDPNSDSCHIKGISKIAVAFNYRDTNFLGTDNITFGKIIVYSLTNPVKTYVYSYPDGYNYAEDKVITFKSPREFYILNQSGIFYQFKNGMYTGMDSLNENPVLKNNGMWTSKFMDAQQKELTFVSENELYIPVLPSIDNIGYALDYDEGKPVPTTVKYNVKTREMSFHNMTHPVEVIENNFGQYTIPFRYHKNKDTSVTYIGCLPYIYLHANGRENKIQMRSKYQTDSIMPLPFKNSPKMREKMILHAQESGHYRWFLYDKYRNCYYRFFALPLPEKRKDGYYNTFYDTRYSVMVIDDKFRVMDEILLPEGLCYLFIAAPVKEGLIINKRHSLKIIDNGYEFYMLKVKVNQAD